MKSKTFSVVISAPSGAGKTTIIEKLLFDCDDLKFVISTTTRPKREKEIDGESYHFIEHNKFKQMINDNQFLEWAEVHQNYYGTSKKEIDRIKSEGKIPIFDVDVQGAKSLKDCLADAIFIFILPPSLSELKSRLMGRNTDSEEQIELRIKNSLRELDEYKNYDYIVINDDLTSAIKDVKSIIHSEKFRLEKMKSQVENIMEKKT
jgi:guanylate kinase